MIREGKMILEESNAIGTTFLRAQLLPEPPRQEVSTRCAVMSRCDWNFMKPAMTRRCCGKWGNKTERLQNRTVDRWCCHGWQ